MEDPAGRWAVARNRRPGQAGTRIAPARRWRPADPPAPRAPDVVIAVTCRTCREFPREMSLDSLKAYRVETESGLNHGALRRARKVEDVQYGFSQLSLG